VSFIKQLATRDEPGGAASALTLAAGAALKANDAAKTTEVFGLLAPAAATPPWARTALLAGVERYLPKNPEGKPVPAMLPVEPGPLLALAHGDTPENRQAEKLVALLKWPGKPGLAEETAAIAARMTPEQKVLFEKGRAQFAAICAACHQPNGEGLSGLAPQLLYSRFVLGPDRVITRIVLCGKQSDGMVMPSLRTLDDETIASILTYIRQSWGHNAPPVAPATVTAVRRDIGGREEPWTDEELQKLLQSEKSK
jgi:mono/diheme cytochrome c family protein